MAGEDSEQSENQNQFVWDQTSQLYYHARSGFYHDPQAGWYYSCNDGLYYKFENGTYVLIDSFQDGCGEMNSRQGAAPAESNNDDIANVDQPMKQSLSSEENLEETNSKLPQNPPPPSEWLEDTLIELYLANYSTQAANSTPDMTVAPETNDTDHTYLSAAGWFKISVLLEVGLQLLHCNSFYLDGVGNDSTYELEEGEWIPDDWTDSADPNANVMDEGICLEEENWRAQYGQVERPFEDSVSHIQAVDLWDWSMVKKKRKDRKRRVARLVGRLVKPTAKLHPSMPSSGHLLKTAPVCEVHLDLVRVKSGQVYRLRNPSTKYLASLSNYDSSNPTRDWGFPQMSISKEIQTCTAVAEKYKSISAGHPGEEDVSLPLEISAPERDRDRVYRDRAAERRALHGGFGVGPGQKVSTCSDDSVSMDTSDGPEDALSESLSNSFGAGSYARRVLENMGWKEGEALGHSNKGLIEPLQATGNKGSAGLGWIDERRKQSIYGSR